MTTNSNSKKANVKNPPKTPRSTPAMKPPKRPQPKKIMGG